MSTTTTRERKPDIRVREMISFESVRKVFPQGGREVVALDGIDITIRRAEFVSIMGPSGSGKSTLLHLAGGMDLPTSGLVRVAGEATSMLADHDLTLLRRRKIGFVFQFFNLMPTLSIEENVALPLLLDGQRLSGVRDRVCALLEKVGLENRIHHTPEELSGGEMQRAAIARALVADPPILLADEPTGNLDTATGREILEMIQTVRGTRTILMVTHDPSAAAFADRRIILKDGREAE